MTLGKEDYMEEVTGLGVYGRVQAIEEFNAEGSPNGGRNGPAGRWLATMTDIFIY